MTIHEFEIEWDLQPNEFEIDLESVVQEVFPELEDLEVTPSGIEQNFKSNKYGYDTVTVKAVESEELNIIPTKEKQKFEGLYNSVNVEAVTGETLDIIPNTENQVKKGLYSKVVVEGDEDLQPENIKKGVNLFGVEGTAITTNAKITDARNLFRMNARTDYMHELLSLCENVSSTSYMFEQATNVTSLDLSDLDTSNVTDMSYMFNQANKLTSIDVSNFDTSNVTNMRNMFSSCSKLTSLDVSNFDTSNVTNMYGMFSVCSYLTSLDVSNFDTKNVTNTNQMFYSMDLSTLDISNFDMSKVNIVSQMFSNSRNLSDLKSFKNLGKGYTQKSNNYSNYKLDMSSCTKLTHESLIDLITNGLYDLNLTYDVANGGKLYIQGLVLGSTNKAKLTADEIAIATNKGWTVS